MKQSTLEDVIKAITNYRESDTTSPLFVVVDADSDYNEILNKYHTAKRKYVSTYCSGDFFPNYDDLCVDVTESTDNILLLGLGEAIKLSGDSSILGRFFDMYPASKVVILCRGIREEIKELCSYDKKLSSPRRLCILPPAKGYTIINVKTDVNFPAIEGIGEILRQMESGNSKTLYVKTQQTIKFTREIRSAYEVIAMKIPSFMAEQDWIDDSKWAEFLKDNALEGYSFLHWRTFLKHKMTSPSDCYLKYVVHKANDYPAYKKLLFTALFDFDPKDKKFEEMYTLRKTLLKDLGDGEVSGYVAETKIKDDQRIFYLTDNTGVERKAILETLAETAIIPPEIGLIYPALREYLHDYTFTHKELGNMLTTYFSEYKHQKITNRIWPEFYQRVLDMAVDGERPYTKLETRGFVLDKLRGKGSSLYWVDALGVEFLGYIQCLAKTFGLKISIHVVQTNLPSITSLNKDFYETWGNDTQQTKALDRIKHEGEQEYSYDNSKLPIHLPEELQIVERVFDKISSYLGQKKADKIIIVSDHGASRLAVINEQENQWQMASKGKHSGRCCPCDEADVKTEYATKENGFWVLANYDRFKGGRKASVEVHGGASLEEVVVPIIEVELFDNTISITNTTPVTETSFKKDAEIILFSPNKLTNVSIRIHGDSLLHDAELVSTNKHKISLLGIKKTGKYTADVFEGHNLIGQVDFEVQRESGKTQDSDWF